jgi:hypothetical protein
VSTPWHLLRAVSWCRASPTALFRRCPGSVPQNAPMTAQLWGNPYDNLDGKRFLVNCSPLPSREYVVLVNWPLAQNR